MTEAELYERASTLPAAIDRLRAAKEPEERSEALADISYLSLAILDGAQELAAETPDDRAGRRFTKEGLSCLSNGVIHEADGEIFPIVTTFGLADEDAQAEAIVTAVNEALMRSEEPQ